MTTKNTFDITIMKFDDKTTPYPSATQQRLIDELFEQSQPLENKVEEIKTLTNQSSRANRPSTSNNQTNLKSDDNDGSNDGSSDGVDKSFTSDNAPIASNNDSNRSDNDMNESQKVSNEKVSHTPVDNSIATDDNLPHVPVDKSSNSENNKDKSTGADIEVDKHNNLTIQKKVVHSPNNDCKKRGRPRKLPTPVIASKNQVFSLKKDSICYLKLYSQNLTREELQAYIDLHPKMTIAEEVAVDLLTGVVNKNPKDIDRYWQIVQKSSKSVENLPAQATGANTLMDSILTDVEGVVFGEIVDE